jgi:probable F420-dependent oxidoreductase
VLSWPLWLPSYRGRSWPLWLLYVLLLVWLTWLTWLLCAVRAALWHLGMRRTSAAWSDGVCEDRMEFVKIRIGVGLGGAAAPREFAAAVDHLEEVGVDSLWLSELVFGALVEPFVGMAHALSRTERLKVGTGVSVLPGRNPVLVAKQLASLAALAPKRVLPAFGLQPARPQERALFAVPAGRRGAVFDESLELLRLLLRQETVSFAGEFFVVAEASVGPPPAEPLDIWLGGSAPGALRRVGRFGDGWLASFVTPDEARAGCEAIQAAAAEAGREIDPEHFGISLAVAANGLPAELITLIRQRRPDADVAGLAAPSWDDARRLIDKYVAAGLSKFVIRPAAAAAPFDEFIEHFANELMPLQT